MLKQLFRGHAGQKMYQTESGLFEQLARTVNCGTVDVLSTDDLNKYKMFSFLF